MSKNKKTFILVTIIAVVAGLLLFWGSHAPAVSGKVSLLGETSAVFGQAVQEFDFGTISMANGKVEHDFSFTNSGDSVVTVNRADTSCMCTEAVLNFGGKEFGPFGMAGMGFAPSINEVVPVGGEMNLRTIFDPAAHGPSGIGAIERQVTVYTDKGQFQVAFKALVTP
ncbi:MAG: DUF1573 domain-containing protein [Patescibacteria group bacterium]|nr:DUF1573 domain-containing protein [Patescibacteria group bacterium]MDE2015459.1 DUF1573 domain-containing protein [Patescibacteria group bacterium]MDE2226925.1 DUF1573 domain-containing protein [Patescibacteria group bacterium]